MEWMDKAKLWTAWCSRRDGAAFEVLVRPELRYAHDLARRLGHASADAEDLVQEALLDLARESTARPVEVGLRAWLGRTVQLKSKMRRRENRYSFIPG